MHSNSWMSCKAVDNAEKEALLLQLQADADGPRHRCEIRERALGQAVMLALLSLLLVLLGGWLASLPSAWQLRSAQLWFWLPGALMLGAGLVGLAAAEALRRRHGQQVLALTPDTLQFANAPEPTPWVCFDGFELEQRHLSLGLVFSVMAGSRAPTLAPACFKSLAAPHAWPVAAGMRVRLWLFNPMLDGQRLDFQALTDLLYAYLNAAQARSTLGQLFPEVQRVGAGQ
ncbi:hypothetical protein A9978_00160 [Pseudomonas sp. UMC65]|nr:hypothetical protein [Pseudomonas sp. UMC65]MBB1622210.1 hypothetical protein [Pseudomonas sp. UME65]